jgi:hypothetical protein
MLVIDCVKQEILKERNLDKEIGERKILMISKGIAGRGFVLVLICLVFSLFF